VYMKTASVAPCPAPHPKPAPPSPKPTPPPPPFPPPPPVPPKKGGRNVLYIVYDDLRPDLSAYDVPFMHTPNIQKLADTGLLFERAYCQEAVCSPSRNRCGVSHKRVQQLCQRGPRGPTGATKRVRACAPRRGGRRGEEEEKEERKRERKKERRGVGLTAKSHHVFSAGLFVGCGQLHHGPKTQLDQGEWHRSSGHGGRA